MYRYRDLEPPPKRTLTEALFDLFVGSVITLVVLVGLKVIVPRIPKQ